MDDDDRFPRNRSDKNMRHSRPKPYERPSAGRQARDGIFKRLSDVFTAVPSWLKEKLSPVRISNGGTNPDPQIDANHLITHDTVDTRTSSREQPPERKDVFHTPPSASRASDEQAGDSEAEDNGSTSTSASSSILGEGELQDSQMSSLAAPLNASVQSVTSTRPRTLFKTLDLSRKRKADINESAESSVNVSRSPSVYTEDSELGGSLNLGTKRARLNLSTATLPGMSRDGSFSRLSKEDMFQSPFYPGKTTYGGASAYRFDASRPFRTQVISVKSRVKPADKPRPMTAMTKRIYEALESLAPPPSLDTPKKQLQTPSTSASITGLFTGFSTVNKTPGPPVKALQTPTPARVTFPPLRHVKETPKPLEQPLPTSTPVVSKAPAVGGKMVTKVSDARKKTALPERMERRKAEIEEEPPEALNLPAISLPAVQLKPISLGQVKEKPVSTKPPVKVELSFAPAKPLPSGKLAECPKVTFSFDAAVDPLAKPKKIVSKWECPTCMVRNDDNISICPCCSTAKPVKASTVSAPVPKSDAGKTTEQKWTCKECLTSHLVDKKQCPVCASPKEKTTVPPPTSPSILDMFKPKPGSWRCSVCDVSNEAGKSKCCSCSSPRTEPSSTKTVSAPQPSTALPPLSAMESLKPKSGSWTCSECFVTNKPESNKCCACSSLKPGSGPAVSAAPAPTPTSSLPLSEFFKPKAGTWKCSVCDVPNDSGKTACVACSTPKPGEKAAAMETAKFAAIGGKLEEPGFKFGIASGKSEPSGFKLATTAKSQESGFKFGTPSAQVSAPATNGFQFGVSTKQPEAKPQETVTAFKFGNVPEAGLKRKAEGKPIESEAVPDKNANILKKPGLKRPDLSSAAEAPVFAKKSEPAAAFSSGIPKPSSEPDLKKTFGTDITPGAEPPKSKELETVKVPEAESISKATAGTFVFGQFASGVPPASISLAPKSEAIQVEKPPVKENAPTFLFGAVVSTATEIKPAETVKPAFFFGVVPKTELTSAPSGLGIAGGTSMFGAMAVPISTPATTSAPLFGSSTTVPTFGAPTSVAAPSFGGGFSFGATSVTTQATTSVTTTQSSVFGAPVTTQSNVFGTAAAVTNTVSQAFSFGTATTTQANISGGAPTSQPPVFGSTTQPSLFGSAAGTQPSVTQQALFGTSAPSQPSMFGTAPALQPAPLQSSVFGTAPAPQLAPSQPSIFGTAPAPQPAPSQPSIFGTTPAAQPAPSQPIIFGTTSATQATTYGAASTVTQTSPFGTTQTTQTLNFGTPASQPSIFGTSGFGTSTTTTSAPTTGVFSFGGSTTAPVFDAKTTSAPLFGSGAPAGGAPASQSVFGAQAPFSSTFGTATTSATPGFGTQSVFGTSQSGPVFGTQSTTAFGSVPTQATPFGGTPSTNQGFNFQPPSGGLNFAFGAQQTSQPQTVFGAPSAPPAFGSGTTPSFGTTPTPAFGATPAASSPFMFGAQPPSLTFGQPGPGAEAQPSTFGFGASQAAPAASVNPFDAAASRPGQQGRIIRKANRRIQKS